MYGLLGYYTLDHATSFILCKRRTKINIQLDVKIYKADIIIKKKKCRKPNEGRILNNFNVNP